MQPMFETLLRLLSETNSGPAVTTDDSVLLIYPPDRELDFREQLVDEFLPAAQAQGLLIQPLDLTGFGFDRLSDDEVEGLSEDELEDYRWARQSLAQRLEQSLQARLEDLAQDGPGSAIVAYASVALYPFVRFGDVLKDLRSLQARIVLAFPGAERGGRLHFMNQPDGSNYLAVKLFWQ
jgi:hypothetical protein